MARVKMWHPDQVNTLEFITLLSVCVGACKPTVGCRKGSRSYQIFTCCESIFFLSCLKKYILLQADSTQISGKRVQFDHEHLDAVLCDVLLGVHVLHEC